MSLINGDFDQINSWEIAFQIALKNQYPEQLRRLMIHISTINSSFQTIIICLTFVEKRTIKELVKPRIRDEQVKKKYKRKTLTKLTAICGIYFE